MITAKQIRGAHALMREINQHVGYFSEAMGYEKIKERFAEAMDMESFSLARNKCNEYQIKAFMDFLKSICMDIGIDTKFPLVIYQDLEMFSLKCLEELKCCITGEPDAEIHFIDKPVHNSYCEWEVGRYRRMALSPKLHQEIHRIGDIEFLTKYLTCIPVKCDCHPDIKDKYLD